MTPLRAAGICVLVAACAVGVAIGAARYRECRAMGFSIFYCSTSAAR